MRVVVATAFGGPEVLVVEERADPVAGPGQVVIEVAAADVLWIETMVRQGAARDHFDLEPPYVPGNGVAGRVRSVAPDVDAGWVGRRVVAHTGERDGYAERAAVDLAAVSPVPDGVDLQDAAALLHDGPTAYRLLENAAVGAGARVLVIGSSGGLGIVSVQAAAALGAHVVATARDERKLARIRELGVAAVIDSEAPDWLEQARSALGGAADVALDNIGGALGAAAFELVADGGRFSAHGTPSGSFADIDADVAERRHIRVSTIADVQMPGPELKRLTERALAAAVAGDVAPVIGQTYSLDEVRAAHEAIARREVFGKTLLVPGSGSS